MIKIIDTERELFRFLLRFARGNEPTGFYPTPYVEFVDQAIAQLATFSDSSDCLSFAGMGRRCPACGRATDLTLADLIHHFSSCRPRMPCCRAVAALGLELMCSLEQGVTLGRATEILVDVLHLPERGLLTYDRECPPGYRTTVAGEQKLEVRIIVH